MNKAESRAVYPTATGKADKPDRMEQVLHIAFRIGQALVSVIAMILTAPWFFELGKMERGYYACGGEVILILLVGLWVWKVISCLEGGKR